MMRLIKSLPLNAVVIALGVTACTSSAGPPSDIENACSIRQERGSWYNAARAASKKWNAPTPVILAIIWRESKFQSEAQTPRKYALGVVPWGRQSSAYGFAQAIDGTWGWYQDDQKVPGADRENFSDAADFVGWYLDKSRQQLGLPTDDARRHYLAYHEGHGGYRTGKWQQKAFLVKASRQVEAMAIRYDSQLRSCDASYANERALAETPLPVRPPFALTDVAAVMPPAKPAKPEIIPATARTKPVRKPE